MQSIPENTPAQIEAFPLQTTLDEAIEDAAALETVDAQYAGLERLPDHVLIRRDAAAHPGRTYSEHVEAAREIAGRTYRDDLRRTLSRELEAEEMGL